MSREREDERGQAIAWVAVVLPALLVVLGLVLDGGLAFAARRDLQDVADAAAQAGAMQVDQTTYAATANVQLDPEQARQAATRSLSAHADVTPGVAVGSDWVQVTARKSWPTVFVRLFGVREMTMTATATAHARVGH
jgi:Flp pilus assembly protein TadG